MSDADNYLRTKQAAQYLLTRYGIGAQRSLAKWRCVGGGPAFHRMGDRLIVYTISDLDAWALGKMSPRMRSTSDLAAA